MRRTVVLQYIGKKFYKRSDGIMSTMYDEDESF